MSFWIIRFTIEWLLWLLFADKKRLKIIAPTCIFAGYLSLLIDQVCELFNLWEYKPNDTLLDLLNAGGIYIVVVYFFIQLLPRNNSLLHLTGYFFVWTILAISLEYIHVQNGTMVYNNWNLSYSYISDWILFWLFYKFHFWQRREN